MKTIRRTRIRILPFALLFVYLPLSADTQRRAPVAGARAASAVKPFAGPISQASEIESVPGSRPPPRRSIPLLSHAADIVSSGEISQPLAWVGTIGVVLLLSFFLITRERRLRLQRERLRKTYQLGEEVLGSSSPEAIL